MPSIENLDELERDINERSMRGALFCNISVFASYICLLLIGCLIELRQIRQALEDD